MGVSNVTGRIEAIIGSVTRVDTIEIALELIVRYIGVGILQLSIGSRTVIETSNRLETTTLRGGVVVFVRPRTSTFSQEVTAGIHEFSDAVVITRSLVVPDVVRFGEEGVARRLIQGGDSTVGIGDDVVRIQLNTSSIQDSGLSLRVTAKIRDKNLGLGEDFVTNVNVKRIGGKLMNDDAAATALPLLGKGQSLVGVDL